MITISKHEIRDFYGKILGWIEEDKDGNQQIRDFYGTILGFYYKNEDKTRDFYGRQVASGNVLTMLLQNH